MKAMATSYAGYKPKKRMVKPDPWTKAVAIAAGLHRMGACVEAVEIAAKHILGDGAATARIVDLLLKLEDWECGCFAERPELFLDEETAP